MTENNQGPTLADWWRAKRDHWRRREDQRNHQQRPSMRVDWKQVAAFVTVILLWAFGSWYGFIAMPDLSALGGLLGIIALVALILGPFLMVRADRMWVRVVGVIVAIVGGVVLATTGFNFLSVFANFSVLSTLGLLVAIIVTALVAWWICRVPRRTTPTTTTPSSPA